MIVLFFKQNNWLYKLLGVEQQVNEWIVQLRSMTWETFKAKVRESANEYLKLDQTKWTVWDPQRGEYVFQVRGMIFASGLAEKLDIDGIVKWRMFDKIQDGKSIGFLCKYLCFEIRTH